MLRQFSRLEKTRSLIIIGFAAVMAISLVFFWTPARNPLTTDLTQSTEVLARVGSDKVTVGDLATLKENYAQMFGGQINLAQLGGDRRFLDSLIRERIIAQEAERLGLGASDAEVAEAIRKRFSDGGKFVGFERYREAVASRYGGIARFERQVRDQIAADKLQAFVTAAISISDLDVQEEYKRKNTSFDLVYVVLTPGRLAENLQPSEEDLRAYYESHKTDYQIQVPQKKVRYVFIEQAKIGEKLNIPESDLRAEYEKLSPENKRAGVRVQQIVLRVARQDLDATVREKAERLVAEARGETGRATEEKFGELARGNSEDPATAKNDGWIGGVVRKVLNPDPTKPQDPLQQTIDMQPGAVTEPIKHGNNYYIFRRGEDVSKTFDQAKIELLVSVRNRRAYSVAAELAARAAARLKEIKSVEKVAQELAAEANMRPADMIRETPFVKPGDDVPNIGSSQQFEQGIEPLNQPGDVGDRTPVKGGFAVPMLVEMRDPRIPEFDEIREKIQEAVRLDQAKNRLDQIARELASISDPNGLKVAAEKFGLKAETSENYKLGSPLGEAGTSAAADEAIYGLKEGQVIASPLKVGDNYLIAGATKRQEADLSEFASKRGELRETMLSTRRNQVYDDYITSVRLKMEAEGKIRIYQQVLDRMAESDPAAAPRGRSPFPTE